ncbi:MAG: UvrD-helicase domain-containing protein [Myxococcota bacterium]
MSEPSHNFGFLQDFDATLCDEATKAEQCFAHLEAHDLAAAGFRRFVERLTGDTLKRSGKPPAFPQESLVDRMHRLRDTGRADDQIMAWFHKARRLGNKGSHTDGRACSSWEVVELMRLARKLSVWWVAEFHSDADVIVPGFKVPQTGNQARDAQNIRRAEAEEERETSLSDTERAEELRKALRPRVVVHNGLQRAFEALEPAAQKALTDGLEAFREDPEAERFVYEKAAGVTDEKLQVVTLVDGLSLAAAVPESDDVIFVLWAGAPEDVVGWMATKRVEIHPAIGTVQLFDVAEAEAAAEAETAEAAEHADNGPPFAAYEDEDLVRLGLPEPLLAAVCAVPDEQSWYRLAPLLPGEAGDALELLLVSGSVEEVVAELGLDRAREVDTRDFGVAVEHPATKRSFRMLEEDEDLEAALDGSLEAWRLFLHPDQRALVRMEASGPVRVLGGAGTGKTVALLHRAAYMLHELVPEGRVFVTTFTRNLALDLEQQLGRMVDPDDLARADVWNLHRLARKVSGLDHNWNLLQDDMADRLWEAAHVHDALGLPLDFYRDEWDQVVQANGLASEREYVLTARPGRGKPLGRRQRRAVWAVLKAFDDLKRERYYFEWPDTARLARERIASGQWTSPYVAVLADEVQDFPPSELKLLRALVPQGPNDLFLVGDAHQRIYRDTRTSMRQCGIHIQGRSRRLRVNYRTTQEIRDWAVATLDGLEFDDLDGGLDTLAGYRSLRSGQSPEVLVAENESGEHAHIQSTIERWLRTYPPEAICIAARTRRLTKRYAGLLRELGHEVVTIQQEEPPGPGLRAATMHRLKGLEFSCVLLAGGRPGQVPLAWPDHDVTERALMYVAATRARDELVVSGIRT